MMTLKTGREIGFWKIDPALSHHRALIFGFLVDYFWFCFIFKAITTILWISCQHLQMEAIRRQKDNNNNTPSIIEKEDIA